MCTLNYSIHVFGFRWKFLVVQNLSQWFTLKQIISHQQIAKKNTGDVYLFHGSLIHDEYWHDRIILSNHCTKNLRPVSKRRMRTVGGIRLSYEGGRYLSALIDWKRDDNEITSRKVINATLSVWVFRMWWHQTTKYCVSAAQQSTKKTHPSFLYRLFSILCCTIGR